MTNRIHFLLALFVHSISGQANDSICRICSCFEGEIDCRNRKLNRAFRADEWSNLTNSQAFSEAYFDNNFIGHLIAFPPLPFVKISYKSNRLVKIDARAFKELTNLEELNLSSNELTSVNLIPSVFEGSYDKRYYEPLKLIILDLSSNELHTIHPDLFEHLPELRRLYLNQNPFKILDKPTTIAISSLPNLEVLDLSLTRIKELPAGFLHAPRKLHELVLKGNLFAEIPSEILAESHELKILNFNENPIKVLSAERGFPEMPSLRQLHISFMPNLTRIEEGSLSGLAGLDYLYCRMNEKLGYISGKAFAGNETDGKWPNLVKLDLSDNALKYIDRDFLKPIWKRIKHLNIMGNPLVCDCENQWIVSELIPLLQNVSSPVDGLECSEPSAMKGTRLVSLHAKNYTMRCLDLYGNHPENDGPILISIFVIVVLTLLSVLGAVVWVKNGNYCRPGIRGNYRGAFYRPTKLSDDSDRY